MASLSNQPDLEKLAPLHPKRVKVILRHLEETLGSGEATPGDVIGLVTCISALNQVMRAHKAIGITADVADVGAGVMTVARAVGSIVRKRK